jgi:hypothetical protein
MKVLKLLILVSLVAAVAAECPYSGGGGNAPSTNNGAPPPPYSVTPAAPPMTTESPTSTPAYGPTLAPAYGPAFAPASELAPAPAPSQKNKTGGKLSTNYYANICPNLESLVQGAVRGMMGTSPIAAAATLRLFFHDCFVTVYICTFFALFLHLKKMTKLYQFSPQDTSVILF